MNQKSIVGTALIEEIDRFYQFLKIIERSPELRKVISVAMSFEASGVRVTLRIRDHGELILKDSLRNGILQPWSDDFIIVNV